VLDVYRGGVVRGWETMESIIAVRRRNGDNRIFENFEYLYVRAKMEQNRLANSKTKFPHGTPRAAIRGRWAAEDRLPNGHGPPPV
jgi:hypothetical protein